MKINFMLIDDCEIDLFINQKNIEKLSINADIKTFTRAKFAIDYLSSLNDESKLESMIFPDIILLDINMPEMNGFQFLDNFKALDQNKFKKIKIYMLSSTTNLKDITDAESHDTCNGFINKPLTTERVGQIVGQLVSELSIN